jgi:hypothetical protein
LSVDGWEQISVSFNHCLYNPITESVIEMSICVLFIWIYFYSQNSQCFSLTATEQPSLHDDEHQIPANWRVCAHGIGQFAVSEPVTGDNYAVVEISNHLATFFIDSKLSRHFVGYSVLEQVP